MKFRNKAIALNLKKTIPKQIIATSSILLALVVLVGIINPLFIRWDNLNGILQQIAPMGIVALGAMFVIITGGIDLSAGSGISFAGVLAGVMYFKTSENLFVLIIVSIIAGAALGALNGLIITKFKLQPFIVTLATMAIAQGLTLLVSEGKIAFLNHPGTLVIGSGQLFGVISVPFLIFICMCLITWVLLNHTRMGIYTFALGGNEEAARFSGIGINKYRFFVYFYAGICTGVGALITICRIGQIAPGMAGTILLDAIAATVIGGTSVQGGRGTVFGTMLGVLIIGVVYNSLTFLNIPVVGQEAIKGIVILIALVIDSFFNKAKR